MIVLSDGEESVICLSDVDNDDDDDSSSSDSDSSSSDSDMEVDEVDPNIKYYKYTKTTTKYYYVR